MRYLELLRVKMSSIGTGVSIYHNVTSRQFICYILQYDLSASQFSPDGRVFQVEYAMKALENSG